MIKNIISVLLIIILIAIFKNQNIINQNIIKACTLFLNNLFPSLFPIYIISSMLINLDILKYPNKILYPLNNILFKINNNLSIVFLTSIFTGSPGNITIMKELYDNRKLNKIDIEKIILFTHFSNPLFILSIVNTKPYLVMVAHYISNIILGIIYRNKKCNLYDCHVNNNKKINYFDLLFNSINLAIKTLLFILGTIVTFYIISTIINNTFTNIILELSQGMNYIRIMTINSKLKTILFGSLLSFGGFCIHFQVYGIINKLHIKYTPYLLARILHAIITSIIIFIFY